MHKGNVIAKLEGVDDVNAAMLLKGKTVHIRRSDAKLPEGSFFLADLIGLDVVDEHGQKLACSGRSSPLPVSWYMWWKETVKL